MHDFHLADQVVKIVKKHAQDNGLARVQKIVIELGNIEEHGEDISPENLEFNIKLLLPVDKVKIKKTKGDTWKLVSIEGK